MAPDDSENITPEDIERKIKDFKSELISISGGVSLLQKIGPSAMTLLGVFLRSSKKRKRKGQKDPIIQIQLFPNVKKYFRDSHSDTEI